MTNTLGRMASFRVPFRMLGRSHLLLGSDGFSDYPQTDSLGSPDPPYHGAPVRTWNSGYGTWSISSEALYASALVGGTAVRTLSTTKGCMNARAAVEVSTYVGGWAGICLRYYSNVNMLYGYYDGTRMRLTKYVSPGPAAHLIIGSPTAFSNGDEISLEVDGAVARLYLRGTQVGGDQTLTDMSLLPCNNFGVITSNTGNLFDNFNVYPISGASGWHNVWWLGDSKTTGSGDALALGGTPARMCTALLQFAEWPLRLGTGGATVASRAASIDTDLAALEGVPEYVCINLGSNDVAALPAKETWQANYSTIIEAIHAKFDRARIYLSKPVLLNAVPPSTPVAACTTMWGYIDELVAAYSYVHDGIDETSLEGGDSYVTNLNDTTHPNATGYTASAALWRTALGY